MSSPFVQAEKRGEALVLLKDRLNDAVNRKEIPLEHRARIEELLNTIENDRMMQSRQYALEALVFLVLYLSLGED